MTQGSLDTLDIIWENKFTICKYLVPEGYPSNPLRYVNISFDSQLNMALAGDFESIIYGSVTKLAEGNIQLIGSRSIAVIGKGDTMKEAFSHVENMIEKVHGPLFYRKDIGWRAL